MAVKTYKVLAWILSGFLAALFLVSGISKLLGVEMQLRNMEDWGFPLWFRFPIGLAEVAFALGLIVPRYRTITIYGIFIWTIIAIITHIRVGQTDMAAAPFLFGVIAGIVLYLTGGKTLPWKYDS